MQEASTPMNCWIILAASMLSCPWGRPVIYTECYYEPVPCLPARPVVVYTSSISPPVAAQVQEVVTENALHEEPVAAAATAEAAEGVTEAVSAEEAITAEPVAFQGGYGLTLSELALDWGVAVIGPGTLYPNSYAVASGGGFFGGPRGSDEGTSGIPGSYPPFCGCIKVPPYDPGENPPPPNPNDTNPVPEPMSLAIWIFAITAVGIYLRKHRQKPHPVPVPIRSKARVRDVV